MDNPDTKVDIAHDDARTGWTPAGDAGSLGERPGPQRSDAGAAWPHLSPTSRGTLVGNPLRVRL
jgi:hypothetical protein